MEKWISISNGPFCKKILNACDIAAGMFHLVSKFTGIGDLKHVVDLLKSRTEEGLRSKRLKTNKRCNN